MLYFIFGFAIIGLFLYVLFLSFKLEKEINRNWITQSFIAGIIRVISNYRGSTENSSSEDLPEKATSFPIPYKTILDNIAHEFGKTMFLSNVDKWTKNNRNLFEEPTGKKHDDDGFNFIYYDFYEYLLKYWYSDELMSDKEKSFLRDDVIVTKENVGELQGEIALYQDLLNEKLPIDDFTIDNIGSKLVLMFYHISHNKVETLKNSILERIENKVL